MVNCSPTDGLCLSSEMFLSMAVIIIAARFAGLVFKYFRQPAVLGEIVAGILLGPSALGQIPGNIPAILFPLDVRIFLNVCAQLGLIIFMFVVGLEVDIGGLANSSFQALLIGGMSVLLPFLIGGFVLSPYLYDKYKVCVVDPSNSTVGNPCVAATEAPAFNLFVGVAMSVTAFPVLARIITDFKMVRLPTGTLVMACAALNDLIAWILLAICLAVKQASNGYAGVLKMVFASVGYFIALTHVLNPILRLMVVRQYRMHGSVGPGTMAFILINLLVTSWFLHYLGFHAMLGAFMFGLAFPRTPDPGIFHLLLEKLETVSVLLLLPCFFLITGLSIDVSKLGSKGGLDLLYVVIVAVFGKVLGSGIPAFFLKMPLQKCATIGVLMNTRGLAEIVILNIGLQQNILNQDLFTILVVMAVITTVMAGPLLLLVYPTKLLEKDLLQLEADNLKRSDAETEDASILLAVVHDVTQAYDIVCAGLDTLKSQYGSAIENGSSDAKGHESKPPAGKPVQVVLLHFTERPGEIGTGLQETVSEVEERHELERCLARLESEGKIPSGGMVMLRVKSQDRSNVNPKTKIICKALLPELLVVDWPYEQQDQDVLKQMMLSATSPILLFTGNSSEKFTPDPAPPALSRAPSMWSPRGGGDGEALGQIAEDGTRGSCVSRWFDSQYARAQVSLNVLHEAIVEEFGGISIACCLGRQPVPNIDGAPAPPAQEDMKPADAKNRMDHLRNNVDQLLNPTAMASADDAGRVNKGNVTIMISGLDAATNPRRRSECAPPVQVDDIFRTLAPNNHNKVAWPSPKLEAAGSFLRSSRSIRAFAPILIPPQAISAEMVSPLASPKAAGVGGAARDSVEMMSRAESDTRSIHMQIGPV